MTATMTAPVNRIANYLPPPVPATPPARQEAWADAVFAAARFFQNRLTHADPDIAERAARAIFDLEKTRLRHARDLAGTTTETEPAARPSLPPLEPLDFFAADEDDAPPAPPATVEEQIDAYAKTEPFRVLVQHARDALRDQGKDASDTAAVTFARWFLRQQLAKPRPAHEPDRPAAPPSPAGKPGVL